MRKALLGTLTGAALLFAAGLHQTAIGQPFAAPAIGGSAPDAAAFENARLMCAPYWYGHFECARVCPVAHRRWHHRYYYCQPMVLGLPWV
jgi:hypothetical protein